MQCKYFEKTFEKEAITLKMICLLLKFYSHADFKQIRPSHKYKMFAKRMSYKAKFKLATIKHAEETNNCVTTREFCVTEKLTLGGRLIHGVYLKTKIY